MFRCVFFSAVSLCFLANGSILLAQTEDQKLDAAIQVVNTSSVNYEVNNAIRQLRMYQEEGKDISAAVPGLRRYVTQRVVRDKPRGVHGDANVALLCLMRLGDSTAIEHYLTAQSMHYQRTGKPMSFRSQHENPWLLAVDPAHHKQALALLENSLPEHRSEYYQYRDARTAYPLLLAWMAHFSKDKTAVVEEVNAAWKQHLARRNSGYADWRDFSWFAPVVCRLATQSELMPNLLAEIQPAPPREQELYGVLLATVAPFRSDARPLLQKWLAEQKSKDLQEHWIAAYVDSAFRLPAAERKQAYAHLIEFAKPIYDRVKPIHFNLQPLTLMNGTPTFTASAEALIAETARAFGEGQFLNPKEYKKTLDVESGLGTSF